LWVAIYEMSTKQITIQLKGLSRGTGYIDLIVAAEPDFSKAIDKSKSFKNKSDADAL
jgi:hypothetical protein